jgi:hypothetical protein
MPASFGKSAGYQPFCRRFSQGRGGPWLPLLRIRIMQA